MRLRWIAASFFLLSVVAVDRAQAAAAPTCADLHLVPAVRVCSSVSVIPVGNSGIVILTPPDPEDRFLVEDLATVPGVHATGPHRNDDARVHFDRADSPAARKLLAENHLAFDPALHDEGYILVPEGRRGLAVIAETSAGLFYGAQTVKQLIRGSGEDTVLLAPAVRDWPAMAHRGLSDDWSRGPLPNMDFLKRQIRTLAAYKYNIFSPYFEHTFAYASTPVAAFPGGAMTPAEARELVAYAARYHITVIPEQESFGHLHHVLKFDQYAPLGETPHGSVLAPGDAGSLPLIGSWFAELAQVFPGPYAHIGADETFELGLGRTHAQVQQQGLGKVYLEFLSRIHAQLEPNHKRLLFWGDIAENSPELVGTLPRDMIAVPWHYDARPDFTKAIQPFTQAGLETWVAPGVNNWNRVFPNNNEALGNIRAFVRDGQRLGATGMLNTVWNDDGEGLFDQNWFGVLFGAAAAWQPGESSERVFIDAYGLAFHNDATGKISQAETELMAAHAVLKGAGLQDAQDSYFWADPFSADGQKLATRLRPVTRDLRLHAERALTLIAEARSAALSSGRPLANEEALDAMVLGARRIDFIGMKQEAADECAGLYRDAQAAAADKARQADVPEMLWSIGSNNGRMEDIRDGYALLGALYKQAWMRDDRPYWYAVNEARYARATQRWLDRGQQWEPVLNRWWDTHTLAPAADVGLPPAP